MAVDEKKRGKAGRRFKVLLLAAVFALVLFFFNPFDADLLFTAVTGDAPAALFVSRLSGQWDDAMGNNRIMGTAARLSGEDLSHLRTNKGASWTLRLLTGRRSVLFLIPDDALPEGYAIGGATHVGLRYRIMQLLKAVKYIPGLGKMGETPSGTRYLDFTGDGVDGKNLVLGLDLADGMLLAVYSTNPDMVLNISERVRGRSGIQPWLGEDPWKLVSGGSVPNGLVLWSREPNYVAAVSEIPAQGTEIEAVAYVSGEYLPVSLNEASALPAGKMPEQIPFSSSSADSAAFFVAASYSALCGGSAGSEDGVCAAVIFNSGTGILPPAAAAFPRPLRFSQDGETSSPAVSFSEFLKSAAEESGVSGLDFVNTDGGRSVSVRYDIAKFIGFKTSEFLRVSENDGYVTLSSGVDAMPGCGRKEFSFSDLYEFQLRECGSPVLFGFIDLLSASELLSRAAAGAGILNLIEVEGAGEARRRISAAADAAANLSDRGEMLTFYVSSAEDPVQNIPLHGKLFKIALKISSEE